MIPSIIINERFFMLCHHYAINGIDIIQNWFPKKCTYIQARHSLEENHRNIANSVYKIQIKFHLRQLERPVRRSHPTKPRNPSKISKIFLSSPFTPLDLLQFLTKKKCHVWEKNRVEEIFACGKKCCSKIETISKKKWEDL